MKFVKTLRLCFLLFLMLPWGGWVGLESSAWLKRIYCSGRQFLVVERVFSRVNTKLIATLCFWLCGLC
jgi:hypothetical protein